MSEDNEAGSNDASAKVGGFGPFVVSSTSADAECALKFNYQRRDILGLRPTDVDIAQSLTEYGVVIVGEGNLSFSFAMAAYFQSWTGIISTLPVAVDDASALLESGYVLCKETCASNQRLLLLKDQDYQGVFTNFLHGLNLPLLKAPSARAPYQHLKRVMEDLVMAECIQTSTSRIESVFDMADTTCICDSVDPYELEASKVAGDIVSRNLWFQCPWKGPKDQKNTASLLLQFLNQASACQLSGGFVMIGVINLYPYCTQYGLMDMLIHPSYEFMGYDDKLIRELLLLGYSFESRYVIDGAEDSHVTLVFRKRG